MDVRQNVQGNILKLSQELSAEMGYLRNQEKMIFDYFSTSFIGKKYQNRLKKNQHVSKSDFGYFLTLYIIHKYLI